MIRSILSLAFLALLSLSTLSQKEIHTILSNAVDYAETVEKAEAYFAKKHPGCSAADLCKGEHRDGDFVKFMRWKAFWSERLNPDGTLGDITACHRDKSMALRGGSGLYENIPWTNLSYEDYITVQIGMGRTTSVGFHPTDENTFYVGGAIGGVWKTVDGGQTYEPKGDDLPFLSVSSIVVNQENPDILYLGLSDHVWYGPPSIGVYKSADGGETWAPTSLSFTFNQNIRIQWMIADPQDADRVFVATTNGLFRTDDGFDSFVSVNTWNTSDLKFQPGNPLVVYQGLAAGQLYRSIDGGITFSTLATIGSSDCLIAVTELEPNRVYVRSGSIMKKSYDGGENFEPSVDLPDNFSMLIFSPLDANTLVSGSFDVWKSSTNGDTFFPVSHWLGDGQLPLIHVDQRNYFTNPLQPNSIYLCNDGGLYTFDVESEEFTNLSDGLKITQFYDIAVSQTDENIIGGGSQDNGNVFRNTNGIWEEYAGTGDGMNQEIDPTNSNFKYWSYQLGGIMKNQNGNNSSIAPPGEDGNGAWETPYKLDPNNPSRIICAYAEVYESLNKGSSWASISPPLNGQSDMEQLAIAPSNSNRIYVARSNKIWVKELFTEDWVLRNLPGSSISDLEVDPVDMNLIYVTVPGYSAGQKVFRSFDAGENWENISGSLSNVSTGAIETYNLVSGGLFVGTDAGVYYRDNTLSDWELYGHIPNTRVEDIEIQYAAELIRIGTHGRGVLEAPVTIGLCAGGINDADGDGICDDFDICASFDDILLGTECNDGDANTYDDVYVDCDLCQGIYFVGLDKQDFGNLSLFPNPSHGTFNVEYPAWQGSELRMYNLHGNLVYSEKLTSQTQVIDVRALSTSMYIIRIVNAEKSESCWRSLIIE